MGEMTAAELEVVLRWLEQRLRGNEDTVRRNAGNMNAWRDVDADVHLRRWRDELRHALRADGGSAG